MKTYYTYRIRVANDERVQVEKWSPQHQELGQPSGVFRYHEKLAELTPLWELACENSLNDAGKTRQLGEVLFEILFDDVLRQDFVNFYHQVVQQKKQLLRVELDIDERKMPQVAALPWEFLCLPKKAHLGTIWMGTVPELAFSRRRSQWIPAPAIQLKAEEKLKIALVISAPSDLPPVAYEKVQMELEQLVREKSEQVELLPVVNSANLEAIDRVLCHKPHIFHFIGHGRLQGDRQAGQIALVDPDFDEAKWVDGDDFSELFNQHRPGVVMLQACETGQLSASQAFVGVASSLVEQNIPVVVAMQYEVSNSTATRFARRFYERLALYDPVDIAAQYGRRAIALGPTQYHKRDFAIPVIFMRVQDGYLFEHQRELAATIYNYNREANPIAAETDDLPCPYRGLFHFGPKDAEYFFGRESFIEELYQATRTRNFIPLLGASGSGKSSVVFAGLVPKLQGEGSWQFTYFRPGVIRKKDKQDIPDPFYALATALVPLYVPDADETEQLKQGNTLADLLRSGEVLLSDVITTIQRHYPGDRLLLIADQFEELYTLCTDPKVRHQFIDILIDNIYTPSADSPLVLVLTMRADFLGHALSYASFAQVLKDDIKLGAMNQTELRDVIEKPAQKLGVTFELGLVETILDDVEDEPGNLPLLEFALTELWKRRKGQKITHQAYQEIGKVQGALTRHADRIFSKLTPEERKAAQRIFLKLVNLGEGTGDTRRQVTQAEIGVSNWPFVKQLADDRLVVTSQNTNNQETVEVVHEALIRNWSQLREWIEESREAMRTARKIEAEAKEWETQGRNKGYLLQDRRLRDAKEFMHSDHPEVELSLLAQDFIKASQQKSQLNIVKMSGFSLLFVAIALIPLHFQLINRARTVLFENQECKPDPDARFLIKYMLRTGYSEELRKVNLCNEVLTGIQFPINTNFFGSNFQDTTLNYANFQKTFLEDAQLQRAYLIRSNFHQAYLKNAKLQYAKLYYADLQGAYLINSNLEDAILRNAKLENTSFLNANLTNTDLGETSLEKSLDLTLEQIKKAKLCHTTLPDYINTDFVNPDKDC